MTDKDLSAAYISGQITWNEYQARQEALAAPLQSAVHYEEQPDKKITPVDPADMLPTPATTMVDERGEPKAFDAFLCRAWGETDLASAELVTDWEGVRRFMIREWLGREDEETLLQIKDDFDRHEEDHNGRGGAHEITFEIGGVSIERVCGFATRPTLQSLGGDAVVLSHTQIADCVTAVRPYSTALATVPAEELIAFVRNVESALSLTSTEKSDGWISVEERLPEIGPEEEGIPVWTWDGNTVEHDEFVANYEQPAGPAVGGWLRTDDWFASDLFSHVTHWQPYSKPAAPKAAEKSGRSE